MAGYIVYELVDPLTPKVFYVGKGRPDRPSRHIAETQRWIKEGRPQTDYWLTRNTHRLAKIAQILDQGLQPITVVVLETNLEDEAFEKEIQLVEYYGRENLVNMTNGGKGNITVCHSDLAREKAKASRAGYRHSVETIARISLSNQGKHHGPLSDQHKQKISEGLKKRGKYGAALLDQRGIKSPNAKLTTEQVRQLRDEYKQGKTQMELSKEFGIGQSTVSRIIKGQAYACEENS